METSRWMTQQDVAVALRSRGYSRASAAIREKLEARRQAQAQAPAHEPEGER